MKYSFKIYFGRNIPDSNIIVSEEGFTKFLQKQKIFDSFTIYEAKGFWKGDHEKVFIVEIFNTTIDKSQQFANLYAVRYNQEDVLIDEIQSNTSLLRGNIDDK